MASSNQREPATPTVTAAASMQINDLLARVNKVALDEDSDDASTDDEAITLGIRMTKTAPDPPTAFDDIHDDPIEVRAHLEYEDLCKKGNFAISDGGADSCVLGKDAHIVSYTGRHAYLTGYDPTTTRSGKIPIGTGYIKPEPKMASQSS